MPDTMVRSLPEPSSSVNCNAYRPLGTFLQSSTTHPKVPILAKVIKVSPPVWGQYFAFSLALWLLLWLAAFLAVAAPHRPLSFQIVE